MARRQQRRASGGSGRANSSNIQKAFAVAVQHMQAGRLPEADAICRDILKRDMLHFDAIHLRAVIAFRAGDLPSAIKQMENLTRLRPDDASAWNDLGMFLHAARRLNEAEKALDRALELSPGFGGAHLNLGNVYAARSAMRLAEEAYQRALTVQPDLLGALNNLVDVQIRLGKLETAEENARRLVKSAPAQPRAYVQLGKVCDHLGKQAESLAAFEKALEISPDNISIKMDFAASLANHGEVAEAIRLCREVLQKKPDHVGALGRIASLSRFKERTAEVDRMVELLDSNSLPEADRVQLGFNLGKVLEDLGDYPGAFRQYCAANSLKHRTLGYIREHTERLFEDIRAGFDSQTIDAWHSAGSAEETPVFVLGMPRSGTTLVEQILASHPEVAAAGELPAFKRLVDELCDRLAAPNFGTLLPKLDAENIRTFASDYIGQLRQYSKSARFVVDKVPANFMFIGMIRIVFPKAKIIHCRRNASDTCLSIFKNHFSEHAVTYGYDFGDLGHYYRNYAALMEHWEQVLPGAIYHIDYEKLVADQETETRKLLAYCGLEWADACLDFHTAKRTVHTASVTQVRQPIYKSSSGIAQKYGDLLNPLLAAIEGGQPS